MPEWDWTTEILPQVQENFNSGIIKGPLIFLIAIALVGMAAAVTIGVFYRNRN